MPPAAFLMAISLLQFVYGTFTVLDSCGASVVREEKRRQSLEESSSSFDHRLTSPGSSISQLTGSFDAKEITSQNKQVETRKKHKQRWRPTQSVVRFSMPVF